jgi:hypothetical protein
MLEGRAANSLLVASIGILVPNLGSWIVTVDGLFVGVVTQNNGLFLSDEDFFVPARRRHTSLRLCSVSTPKYLKSETEFQSISQGWIALVVDLQKCTKYCYALLEEDFLNRNGGTNEASRLRSADSWGESAEIHHRLSTPVFSANREPRSVHAVASRRGHSCQKAVNAE